MCRKREMPNSRSWIITGEVPSGTGDNIATIIATNNRFASLLSWPSSTRYAVWAVHADGKFMSYSEHTHPCPPPSSIMSAVRGAEARTDPAKTRDDRRKSVLDFIAEDDATKWETGSWQAGKRGRPSKEARIQTLENENATLRQIMAHDVPSLQRLQQRIAALEIAPRNTTINNNTINNNSRQQRTKNN